MFTGIIEEIGTVLSIRRRTKSFTLEIEASKVLQGTIVGDSIATNGVCLTVTSLDSRHSSSGNATRGVFTADVMPETVNRTSLGQLKAGSKVNLERALTLQQRLGGHIVSGHIDGTGVVVRRYTDDDALWLWIECSNSIMRYVVEKGSIAIQGVSLTVAKAPAANERSGERASFAVSLIPHTQGATTLLDLSLGDTVNLENDIVAKYVENMMYADTASQISEKDKTQIYRDFLK